MSDAFVSGPVTVEVPATCANLGPGYDCFGLALSLYDTLTARVLGSGDDSVVEIEGEGATELPRDHSHLVMKAISATFALLGFSAPPAVSLSCVNRIPQSRGLGSSAAAIVGGITLARALIVGASDGFDDDAVLNLANRLEGHPDNVAAALRGGFVISGLDAGGVAWAQSAPIDPQITAVLFVPPDPVSTGVARGLLPDVVPHAAAAANSARTALLVAALGSAPERLMLATEDFLHQQFREPAMPGSMALVGALRAAGIPAVISGAGPSVLAFRRENAADAASHCPEGWVMLSLSIDRSGARVVVP